MPLPSLYKSQDSARAWSMKRAALYGAGLGALAALVKLMGTFGAGAGIDRLAGGFAEIVVAACGFSLLCAGASALRNFLLRRSAQ